MYTNEQFKLGKYRKCSGKDYQLLYVARNSNTMEEYIVYKALYGDGDMWVLPSKMWFEEVDVDGKKVPRFTFLGE